MTYSDKLKDPRWQRKRLEVLNRDNFTCVKCGNNKKTLHVHHLKYKGSPWDISLTNLETLCETCHENEHSKNATILVNDNNLKDEFGRWKYRSDNPDYPPIYQTGYNQPLKIVKSEDILKCNPNNVDLNDKYSRSLTNVKWEYEHYIKFLNMNLEDYEKEVCSKKITYKDWLDFLLISLNNYCIKTNISIIDKDVIYGYQDLTNPKNVQYL